jgi:hypothetical protein
MYGIALLASVALLVGSVPPQQPERSGAAFAACPAESDEVHWLALNLATSEAYATARSIAALPLMSPSQVRVLTDASDAALCQRMLSHIQQRGVDLTGSVVVYYQAGAYYLAVVTYPRPEPPPAPAGYVHIRTGWTTTFVFNPSLSQATALAL